MIFCCFQENFHSYAGSPLFVGLYLQKFHTPWDALFAILRNSGIYDAVTRRVPISNVGIESIGSAGQAGFTYHAHD